MKFNPLPEEHNSPQLIELLKEIYKMRAEDRESLARIEAQVAARMRSRLMKQPLPEHQESHSWQPRYSTDTLLFVTLPDQRILMCLKPRIQFANPSTSPMGCDWP